MKLASHYKIGSHRPFPSVLSQIAIISYDFIEKSQNSRPLLVYKALGDHASVEQVKVYCADFSHHKKQYVSFEHSDFQPLTVPAYRRNISFHRIFSYWIFALKIAFNPALHDCSLLYFCVPANELAIIALWYKWVLKKTVVLDVVDLWPEAFPLPSLLNHGVKLFLNLTSRPLRNWLFRQADLIVTQSAYFQEKIGSPPNSQVVLMGTTHQVDWRLKTAHRRSLQEQINILYLGSINAINDLESLIEILMRLKQHRAVHLSVVGGGKRLPYLQQQVEALGITTCFHGICFDPEVKNREFLRCHFGYNGYVSSTEVAISYKSLEYLAHGLPLLNSTKGDSRQLVESERLGFNFLPTRRSRHELVGKLLNLSDAEYYQMQQQALNTFEKYFAWPVFQQNLTQALSQLEPEPSSQSKGLNR